MQISVIRSDAEFHALAPEWQELHERALGASVFNSWEWLYAWWGEYRRSAPLRIVLVRQGEVLCGILPVYIDSVRLLRVVPVRILRFIGVGGDTAPDDLDALLDPAHANEAARVLVSAICQELEGEWDVLALSDMAEDSVLRQVLSGVFDNGMVKKGVSASIAYLTLPKSWDSYLEGLHRDRRYTLRQTRRRILSQPESRLFVWDDAARLDEAIDRLVALHLLRWRDRGEEHAFSTREYINFHRRVMHAFQTKGWLRLYCLEVGGVIIAMYYCYRFRNHIYYFQGGFDPAFSKSRPGLVLMGAAIEHAIGEGNEVFDMLRGEYEYKTQWAKQRRSTHYCTAYHLSIPALLYRLRREWLPALKHSLTRLARRPVATDARSGAASDA